jgi:hypothetical protein
MSKVFKHSDICVSKITFGSPKSLDNGGKIIGIYHESKPLIIQTPNMPTIFGINRYEGSDKYTIDLSFKHRETNPDVESFMNMLSSLDEKLIKEGIVNSSAWFKRKTDSRDVIEALYTPITKYSKDKDTGEITNKYPPSTRLQVPHRDGKIACDVYDTNKEIVDITDINTKGMYLTAIIQCNGIWVAGGKFGCNFKILQMKVEPRRDVLVGYGFLDDERL